MIRTLRVIHVITRLIVGGAQENTIATVMGLRVQKGVEVGLISGPTSGPEGSLVSTVDFVPGLHTVLPELVRQIHPWKDVLALVKLTRFFSTWHPHLVHTHSGKAGLLGRLAARRAGVPVIIHTIHGPSFGGFQGWLANTAFLAAERMAGRVTTHFIGVAQAMNQQYLQAGIGTPDRYSVIYSGFKLEPFLQATNDLALRARWGLTPDDLIVGKVARLFELKGHDDLFAAFPRVVQQFPRARLLLVGDGPWRKKFEQQACELGLREKIVFTGLVAPEQIPALMGIMDLVAHLSRREGLPRALAQGLAAGKPVIAYDCDGAREVCRDGQTGFLLSPGADITDAVLRLANDPELRLRMGTRGRLLVQENFSEATMVSRIFTLYQQLCPMQHIGS